MNAITARIGADPAPLRKGLDESQRMVKASAKKWADDQKAAAKEAIAAQQRTSQAIIGVSGDLFRAQSGAQALSAGLNTVSQSLKLGAAGAIAVAAVTSIVDKIDDAIDQAEELRTALGRVTGPQSGARNATEGDIVSHLEESVALARQLNAELDKTPRWVGVKQGFADAKEEIEQATGWLGRFMAGAKGLFVVGARSIFGGGTQTNLEQQKQAEAAAQADVGRLVDKRQELVSLREKEFHTSEEQAALDKVDMAAAERKGAIIEMGKKNMVDVRDLTAQVDAAAALEKGEIDRKARDVEKDREAAQRTARGQAGAAIAGLLSPSQGRRAAIAQLRADAEAKRQRADASNANRERQEQLRGEAALLEIQANEAEAAQAIEDGQLSPSQLRARNRKEIANAKRVARNMRAQATNAKERARTAALNGRPIADNIAPVIVPKDAGMKKAGEDIANAAVNLLKGAKLVIHNT